MRRAPALIAILALLTGCKSAPALPVLPRTVRVEVARYVPVPDALTEPCPVYEAREQTYAEAKRLALLRRESIEACNSQLAKIRALGEVKP